MTARELFDQGRLDEAIAAQNEVVKAHPTDLDARHELSVYLCFAGELDRAFMQLNTMAQQDPALAMSSTIGPVSSSPSPSHKRSSRARRGPRMRCARP